MNKRRIYWITGLLITGLIIFLTFRFNRFYQKLPPLGEDVVITIPESKLLYGLPVDSFHVEESYVARNQNLSDILIDRGVSAQAVDQIAKNSVTVFDVRKMKAGNQYTLFYSKDERRSPLFLAYNNNGVDYYLYSLTDSLKVLAGKHDVISKRQTMSGVITSSL